MKRNPLGLSVIFGLLITLAFMLGTQPAAAGDKELLFKGGTPWGKTHGNSVGVSFFAKRLEELSQGKIKGKGYFGGSLVTAKEELDLLKNGIVDFAPVVVPYHAGIIPEIVRVSITVPFITDLKSWQWLWENTDWYYGYLKKMGLHPLYTCYQELVLSISKPIEDIENPSLKGRKIRAPGLGFSQLVECLGADSVSMPSPEVPTALATGIVAGLYTTLDTWDVLGIHESTPHVYLLDVPFATNHCMTEAKYQALPDWAKKVVDQAAKDTTQDQIRWARTYRQSILDKFKNNQKVKFYVFDENLKSKWMKALAPFYGWLKTKFDPDMSRYLADCEKAWAATHDTPFPGKN